MLYQLYETQRALMSPFSEFAYTSAKLYSHPLSPFSHTPLAPRVSHLVVRDATDPAPAEGTSSVPSAEGRFYADLAARRAAAPDDATRRAVDLAIRLGRDALAGRAVRPPEPERG